MEMMFANERRAPRHVVPVECQVVREGDFAMLGEVAVDLSTCGMLLLSEVEAAIGDDVVVSLRIPGREQWIDARGKVARLAPGRRSTDRASGVAIAFDPLTDDLRCALEEALCAYPTVPPSRPPRVDYAATAAMISLA
jgi:Tfp pilus assembly protein PilZ